MGPLLVAAPVLWLGGSNGLVGGWLGGCKAQHSTLRYLQVAHRACNNHCGEMVPLSLNARADCFKYVEGVV